MNVTNQTHTHSTRQWNNKQMTISESCLQLSLQKKRRKNTLNKKKKTVDIEAPVAPFFIDSSNCIRIFVC